MSARRKGTEYIPSTNYINSNFPMNINPDLSSSKANFNNMLFNTPPEANGLTFSGIGNGIPFSGVGNGNDSL